MKKKPPAVRPVTYREAPERPDRWKHLTLVETKRRKFSVLFPYTYLPVGDLAKQASGCRDATDNLPLTQAIVAGDKLDRWLQVQEGNAKKAGKSKDR